MEERHAVIIGRLWNALHERFGPGPVFDLREGKHSYVLRFTRSDGVSVKTVREVIDDTVPFGVGIMLADRDPHPAALSSPPPWFNK